MRIFQTTSGNIGKKDDICTLWLVPDCLNVFQWHPAIPDRTVDWDTVNDVELTHVGFTEICKETYMRTNEIQKHRNKHDPVVAEAASEHALFTRARSDSDFVRDVHLAVRNWPEYIPRNSMGRRLWETINTISQRAALDEDNKRFLSVSNA
tara:strand:+ start:7405 stop:7857 length:453 start_codon:yes stop_codon:yes gene_type:complete